MTKTITDIKYGKYDLAQVSIYLDGDYAFSVSLLAAASLVVGEQLTSAEIGVFEKAHKLHTAYCTALNYLTRSPRSFYEIQCHLRQKQHAEDTIASCMEKLQKNGYIDDDKYARLFVENRIRFNPKSIFALRFELSRKGIDAAVIEEVLSPLDDYELAFTAVQKKMRRFEAMPEAVLKPKMMAFLSQRGFNYDVAGDTLDRVLRDRHVR